MVHLLSKRTVDVISFLFTKQFLFWFSVIPQIDFLSCHVFLYFHNKLLDILNKVTLQINVHPY